MVTSNDRIKATLWRAIDRLVDAERRKDYSTAVERRAHLVRLLDAALDTES